MTVHDNYNLKHIFTGMWFKPLYFQVKTTDLKNCTKEMVIEYHNKTIYDCKNVTKRHCTTLWTVNDAGQKVNNNEYLQSI